MVTVLNVNRDTIYLIRSVIVMPVCLTQIQIVKYSNLKINVLCAIKAIFYIMAVVGLAVLYVNNRMLVGCVLAVFRVM
jgi:hypothetical protein